MNKSESETNMKAFDSSVNLIQTLAINALQTKEASSTLEVDD
jgi:hypothetical protein